jgi:predicted enzyme related to lactoylglutathione lyase
VKGRRRSMNLNSVLIGSEDPGQLRAYYAKVFGEPGFEADGYSGWQFGSGWLTIGPHSEVHGKNPEPGRLIWNIETADVPGEFERLKTAGATVVREPYSMGEEPVGWIATFSDPDGNYFQLMTPM